MYAIWSSCDERQVYTSANQKIVVIQHLINLEIVSKTILKLLSVDLNVWME